LGVSKLKPFCKTRVDPSITHSTTQWPQFRGKNSRTFEYVFHTYSSNALPTYHTRNKGDGTNSKVEVQIICEQISRKNFELLHAELSH